MYHTVNSRERFARETKFRKGWEAGPGASFFVKQMDDGEVLVFVPAAPNPTTGFILKVPAQSVKDVDMSVEEAFKVILSCGALLPSKTS